MTGNIQGTTQKAMLGATIPLNAVVSPTGGAYQWKLDNTVVGGNTSSLNQTINSLGSHTISVTYTKLQALKVATVTINVVVPEFDVTSTSSSFSGQESSPFVTPGSNCINLIDINYYLTLSCPYLNVEYGSGIDVAVFLKDYGSIISNKDESRIKMLQIVNTSITKVDSSTGACQILTRRGTQDNPWMLDASDPYGYPAHPAVGDILISSGPNIKTNDNPNLLLNNGFNWTLDDKFEMYLVYFTGTVTQPQNQKAIGVLTWTWGGSTRYVSGSQPPHVAVSGTLLPSDAVTVYGTKITATNQGTGIRTYDSSTVQSFVSNSSNWRTCPQ